MLKRETRGRCTRFGKKIEQAARSNFESKEPVYLAETDDLVSSVHLSLVTNDGRRRVANEDAVIDVDDDDDYDSGEEKEDTKVVFTASEP